MQLTDLPSLRKALKILHTEYHVPNVVISSIPLRHWLKDALPPGLQPQSKEDISDTDYLLSIVSSTHGNTTDGAPSIVHARCVTCLPGYFSGVGDLFSALVLGHYEHSKRPSAEDDSITAIAHAVAQALSKTHAMLTITHEYAATLPEDERQPTDEELDKKKPDRVVRRMRGRELRLIQGQDIIRNSEPVKEPMGLWDSFWTGK